MKGIKQRQQYTKDFKLEAVHLAESSSRPKTRIAEELGISDAVLYKWCRAFKSKQAGAFQATGPTTEQQELRRLNIELQRVKEERDILKKAMAFFVRESE